MAFASLASAALAGLKIASLDLCADEYLLMFADRAQVASVSFLGKNDDETPLADRARGVPVNDGSIESVIRYRPDILLTSRPIDSGRRRIAERLGMEIVALPYAPSPDAVADNVRLIGDIVGANDRSRDWLDRFERLKADPPGQRTSYAWISDLGPDIGSPVTDWLALVGYDKAPLLAGLNRVEQVAAASASTLIVSDYQAGRFSRIGEWRNHPLVKRKKAREIAVDGRVFVCAGPAMLGEMERLRAL